MIILPKMLSANSNDCLVASVQMACMYWRQEKPNLHWKNAPLDFNDTYWDNFNKKGLSYVRNTGVPTNNVSRFLKNLSLPLNAELQFLEDTNGLRRLIDLRIPPIVLYDRHYYFKQVEGLGHSVVLVDYTNELLVSIDPAFGPKFSFKLSEEDFLTAWKLKKNAVIIITPKAYRFAKIKVPSTNLLPYLTMKESVN
jgi:ABC-type bacteriocin/lantibiotic exporter with double-glycine peptidase domain